MVCTTRNKPVQAWYVRVMLIQKTNVVLETTETKPPKKPKSCNMHAEGKIVVYRSYFARLLAAPKPLRDQLIIELPMLMGFRTGEVCTAKKEHVNFESGDMQVYDSKKYRLYLVPLHPQVAKHLDKHIKKVDGNFLFTRSRKSGAKGKDPHLTDSTIQVIWKKWCEAVGIPYMSPRYGRAYFAVDWHMVRGKSIYGLMAVLRHERMDVTQKYLARIVSYEDVKREFNEGLSSPFKTDCVRSDKCPVACEGCRCRMFQPKIEVKA